jgi:hypothetical protein
MPNRRDAILQWAQFFLASLVLKAGHKFSQFIAPLFMAANVFDFARLAKAKPDPLAWDYMDERSNGEFSLRANRACFDNIIVRLHLLQNDVSKIDLSTILLSKKLKQPIYFPVIGGRTASCRMRLSAQCYATP